MQPNAAPALSDSASASTTWRSSEAVHLCGLASIRPQTKGTLTVGAQEITFDSGQTRETVPYSALTSIGSGNERVELWGTKGRLLRMAIPNGGGLLAATMMHHRVDMLTLEFRTPNGAYHAAVFAVPSADIEAAEREIAVHASAPASGRIPTCRSAEMRHDAVVVVRPEYGGVNVPPAYQALVYERMVERLTKVKGIGHIYREGEVDPQRGCAHYAVSLAATQFKRGSQVARASTGPVGLFVGTTQIGFRLKIIDLATQNEYIEELKATQRTEGENTKVADGLAKKVAKQFAKQYHAAPPR